MSARYRTGLIVLIGFIVGLVSSLTILGGGSNRPYVIGSASFVLIFVGLVSFILLIWIAIRCEHLV